MHFWLLLVLLWLLHPRLLPWLLLLCEAHGCVNEGGAPVD
jgi:hypothetical protein